MRLARTSLKLLLALILVQATGAEAEIGRFDGYEIRVIRPRFMAKRGRIELGGQTAIIMNQSFIYTLMATGLLDYHFSEMFAFEAGLAYGFSIDKEDKRILDQEFSINTQILRTQYIASGGLLWTPIYGKTQLPSGTVVYFDSFVTAQAGMTGIAYTFEHCNEPRPNHPEDPEKPAPRTKGYPTGLLGFGQKYFVTQDFGLRWDVRDYFFPVNSADSACDPGTSGKNEFHQNIILQFGASTFF